MPVIDFTGIVLLCVRQIAPLPFLGALREGAKEDYLNAAQTKERNSDNYRKERATDPSPIPRFLGNG